jgi:hypothetical protein
MVKDMDQVEFGKKKKETEGTTTRKRKQDKKEKPSIVIPFKKKLIFFKYLSYWKTLDTPHAINCLLLEKNVFESTIDVLLDIKKKTNDGLKSRMDLVNRGIRDDLHPQSSTQNGKVDLLGVGYNLTIDERRAVC